MSQYGDAAAPPVDPYTEAYNEAPPAPPASNGEREVPPPRGRSRSRSPPRGSGGSNYRRSPPPRRPPHAPIVCRSVLSPNYPGAYLAKQAPNPSNVLGVFGLSIRTTERDLDDEFSRFGRVEKVTIVYDQRVSFPHLHSCACCPNLTSLVRPFSRLWLHQHVYR